MVKRLEAVEPGHDEPERGSGSGVEREPLGPRGHALQPGRRQGQHRGEFLDGPVVGRRVVNLDDAGGVVAQSVNDAFAAGRERAVDGEGVAVGRR